MPKREQIITPEWLQNIIDGIENTPMELARSPLPALAIMPNHNQFLCVKGIHVTLAKEKKDRYLRVNYTRVAVPIADPNDEKEYNTGKLPIWERFGNDLS